MTFAARGAEARPGDMAWTVSTSEFLLRNDAGTAKAGAIMGPTTMCLVIGVVSRPWGRDALVITDAGGLGWVQHGLLMRFNS